MRQQTAALMQSTSTPPVNSNNPLLKTAKPAAAAKPHPGASSQRSAHPEQLVLSAQPHPLAKVPPLVPDLGPRLPRLLHIQIDLHAAVVEAAGSGARCSCRRMLWVVVCIYAIGMAAVLAVRCHWYQRVSPMDGALQRFAALQRVPPHR